MPLVFSHATSLLQPFAEPQNPNTAMQQPETTSYYRYWAKAHKAKDNEPLAYHVLPYHLLDVAAVLGGAL